MSMFKKMKERITDEVNSATNKLQSMQLIDNLALSLGQTGRTDHLVSLPHINTHQQPSSSTNSTTATTAINNKTHQPFSLLDDNPMDDEELNSELSSPQQLFNEFTIPRKSNLQTTNNDLLFEQSNPLNAGTKAILEKPLAPLKTDSSLLDSSGSLKSDIESEESGDDELINDTSLDGVSTEIDLSSDTNNRDFTNHFTRDPKVEKYRSKYRDLVHLVRQLLVKRDELNRVILDTNNRSLEKTIELKNQIKNLSMQLQTLQQCHESSKTQTASQTSPNIDNNKTTGQVLPAHNDKESTGYVNSSANEKSNKIRDLEQLLAKCKESLKAKNGRIEQLEQNLKYLDSLKEENISLKSDITKLRQQHEDWTVSIAESKRSVHEELETRTAQLNTLKTEYNDLSRRSQDSSAILKQQSYKITDLEGQIVRMNSVHEQEKVNLKKEHEKNERTAVMQINQEHERKLANQKQEFQKIIDSLKNDLTKRDEGLLKSSSQIKLLEEEVKSSKTRYEELSCADKQRSEEYSKLQANFEKCDQESRQKIIELQKRIDDSRIELETANDELKATEIKNRELVDKLESLESSDRTKVECQTCPQIKLDAQKLTEASQQEIYELNSKVTVLSSAIEDQEKEIRQLRLERDSISSENQKLSIEFDELTKKNDSLSRVIQDTETDIQNQQEQLDELVNCKQELANLKKSHNSQIKDLEKVNSMLGDKNEQINTLVERKEAILNDLKDAKLENEKLVKLINSLENEKNILKSNHDKLSKEFSYNNQTMVACIINTMKNLESPGVSPSSDEANCPSDEQSSCSEDIPKSSILMEQLSRLAIERSNAYMTATQRLEASILENKALLSETDHLKEELDRLNSERKEYLASSTQEAENLREENQILTNECQTMSENIVQCEEEISYLKSELQLFKENTEKTEAAIKLYKEKLLELEENQVTTEERIKEYIEELNSLRQLRDTYEKQLSETSNNHAIHIERVKQLERKFAVLVSDYETKCQNLSQRISEDESTIAKLKNNATKDKPSSSITDNKVQPEILEEMEHKLGELQMDLLDKTEAFDAEKKYYMDTIKSLKEELTTERNRTMSNDHNYQIGALQRVIQQYQEENQRLKELSRASNQQNSSQLPDATEYEYLKNIVLQFMLGKEPLVLAKVISAVFRFSQDQIDQVVKTQESLQSILNSNKVPNSIERRR